MLRVPRTGVILAVAVLGMLVVSTGCGNMGAHHATMHGQAGGAPQTPVITDAIEVTVEIRDFDFSPRDLTIPVGAVVTWLNRDGVPHDATEDDRKWGTSVLGQGDGEAMKFDTAAVFSYYCSIHPSMKATLTVA